MSVLTANLANMKQIRREKLPAVESGERNSELNKQGQNQNGNS